MRGILVFVLLLCLILSAPADPTGVPLSHPVYDFLDRMETFGHFDRQLRGLRPFPRGQIAQHVNRLQEKKDLLTKIDQVRLHEFNLEFMRDLDGKARSRKLEGGRTWHSPLAGWKTMKSDFADFLNSQHAAGENHLFLYEDSSQSFYADYSPSGDWHSRNSGEWRAGFRQVTQIRWSPSPNIGCRLQVAQAQLWGDSAFRAEDPMVTGNWMFPPGKRTFADQTRGEISARFAGIDLSFGQEPLRCGPSQPYPLILSDHAGGFPHFRLSYQWKWGAFHYLHGKLMSVPVLDTAKLQYQLSDKWAVAHRLEIAPVPWMIFALTESLIYGNRSTEWAYWIPVNIYMIAERGLYDRDNNALAVDASLLLPGRMRLLGAVFVDDYKKSEAFTDWYGNKYAWQVGISAADPVGWNNSSVCFNYTAIMPWVYTHRFDINRYAHKGLPLGHWAGPNSQVMEAKMEKEWHRRFSTRVGWRKWSHGENTANQNLGGNLLQGHDELIGTQSQPLNTRTFLQGNLEVDQKTWLACKVEPFNGLFLEGTAALHPASPDGSAPRFVEYTAGIKLEY